MFGTAGTRSLVVTPSARIFPASISDIAGGTSQNVVLDGAAGQIAVERRRRAFVGNVHEVEPEDALERLGVEMMEGAGPRRSVGELARLLLGELDQVRYRLNRQGWIDHQHERHAREQRDRGQLLAWVVGQVLAHGDVDREHRARRHHDGVAVGRRARDRGRRRRAAAARTVLDHEWLAQALLELRSEGAGERLVDAARRERDDEVTARFG